MSLFYKYQYLGCCADFPISLHLPSLEKLSVEDLNRMIREAKEISYQQLLRQVGHQQVRNIAQIHDWDMKGPCSVKRNLGNSFHSSRIHGYPCYFLVWSQIEFIWVSNSLWEETDDRTSSNCA